MADEKELPSDVEDGGLKPQKKAREEPSQSSPPPEKKVEDEPSEQPS